MCRYEDKCNFASKYVYKHVENNSDFKSKFEELEKVVEQQKISILNLENKLKDLSKDVDKEKDDKKRETFRLKQIIESKENLKIDIANDKVHVSKANMDIREKTNVINKLQKELKCISDKFDRYRKTGKEKGDT